MDEWGYEDSSTGYSDTYTDAGADEWATSMEYQDASWDSWDASLDYTDAANDAWYAGDTASYEVYNEAAYDASWDSYAYDDASWQYADASYYEAYDAYYESYYSGYDYSGYDYSGYDYDGDGYVDDPYYTDYEQDMGYSSYDSSFIEPSYAADDTSLISDNDTTGMF